jgi:histone deacetylase 1/2
MPTPMLGKDTSVHRLFKTQPNYDFLRIFGCTCWPSLRKYNAHKLEFRSKQCVFLGYSPTYKGYKCLDRSTGRIYISRDVVFDESVFPCATPGVSVDIPTLREAITFPSFEPATSDHVHQYDLSYLPTDPAMAVEPPLFQDGVWTPASLPAIATTTPSASVIDVHGLRGSVTRV